MMTVCSVRLLAAFATVLLATPVGAQDVPFFTSVLNAQRHAHDLPALSFDPLLYTAAEAHARDMSRNHFLSHSGSDGSQLVDRVDRAGYCWWTLAENLAWKIRGEADVVMRWMDSPGHRRNILNPQVRDFGVARAGDTYWVLVLGHKRSC